jgi:hypothetical protein
MEMENCLIRRNTSSPASAKGVIVIRDGSIFQGRHLTITGVRPQVRLTSADKCSPLHLAYACALSKHSHKGDLRGRRPAGSPPLRDLRHLTQRMLSYTSRPRANDLPPLGYFPPCHVLARNRT